VKRHPIILFKRKKVRIDGGIIAATMENNAICPESFGVIYIIVKKRNTLVIKR
jgi:hypothetical protein